MKVLVTGATGFIGRHLVHALCEKKYDVKVFVRPSSNTESIRSLNVEIISGDITDYSSVEQAVDGCQHIYHLAGQTSSSSGQRIRSDNLHSVNVIGTENIARAASKSRIERLVYGSSAGVYGIIKSPPAHELNAIVPNTPYRESKLSGEKVLQLYHQETELPIIIARLSSVFGPGSSNWLNLCKAISTGQFRLLGDGKNYLHLTHILDTVDGLLKCALTPNISGGCYNIAAQEPIQMSRFVEIIAQTLGVQIKHSALPSLPFNLYFSLSQILRELASTELPRSHQYEMFLTSRILSISKAQDELNYHPSRSVEDGLRDTVKWYMDSGKL